MATLSAELFRSHSRTESFHVSKQNAHTCTQHPHPFCVRARTWPKAEYYDFTTVVSWPNVVVPAESRAVK